MKKLNPKTSAGYLTNMAARLFAQAIQRQLRPLGVSTAQLPVFFALADGCALSQKALTQLASTEQSSMAEALARMQKEGLVRRESDPQDGRSYLYSLTPLAQDKVKGIERAVQTVNAMALSELSTEEQADYKRLLKKVIQTMRLKAQS